MNKIAALILSLMLVLSACRDSNSLLPIDNQPVYPAVDGYPAWSPDGSKIIYNHAGWTKIYVGGAAQSNPDSGGLWLMGADGSNQHLFLKGDYYDADWSPDGQWLVMNSGSQIYKIKITKDSLIQLTFGGRNFFPSWSPDGRQIAYDSDVNDPNGANVIWKMMSDGADKKDISQHGVGEWRMPAWSPNGLRIVHQRYIGVGAPEIYTMDTSGNNPIRLTFDDNFESYPEYSPNGTKIAFWSDGPSRYGIWVMNEDGSNLVQLADRGTDSPSWSPDGTKIAYIGWTEKDYDPRNNGTVWVMNADGTNKKQLTYGPDP